MAELHRHIDRDGPEARHDAPATDRAERVTAAEFDRDVAKAVEANRRQKNPETNNVDEPSPDRRPGLFFETPDTRKHSPEKPAQEHPDITAPYAPSGEVTRHYRDGDNSADTNRKSRTETVFDELTENVEDIGDRTQQTVDRVTHLIDPARPTLSQTSTQVGRPVDRPTINPQLNAASHDVVSNALITTIFVAEATRRTAALVRSAIAHRRDEST